ncbi:MAG: LysR family transcriptional regulator [Rhodocyclaceae bacterium]|nr:LysR family transcriptional regulator [Rhodocyclaceae bacterium]MCP5231451.1 LysR family transcriptional regulator [Zoogloeaceae bacterium]MCP5239291.1 LysR family transcriptional regulator [Zoogloeaceae bacterium]MCP5255878.1 LysR family transcriptional regulator [Zoogloeaceae bacterium]MCW5616051.1 LysR family transcriptional regulator [Rhodocyclaceae bacterium]
MDRLQSMKIFACVVESGGFTAAAEQLGLSQAQVTRHVAALESELGLRLLERTTRRMRLTEIGEAYLERCRRILALVEEADAIGEAHRGEPRGVLRLTAAASFARVHLAPAIAEYMQQYPETAFELILSDRTLNMVDEGIDLAFRITQAVDPGLVARRLAPCRVVVCAAPAYLARRGKPLKPSDLSDHDCLSHSYFARSAWPFRGAGGEQTITVRTRVAGDVDFLHALVRAGAGIAHLPSYLVGDDIRAGALVALLEDDEIPPAAIFAVYPSRHYLLPKVRAFLDFFAARIGSPPYWERDW